MQAQVLDKKELEEKVKEVYKMVAEHPEGKYHFEMGRALAEKLGYPSDILDKIPMEAIESFAGVGYHFDLANIQDGERVLDLGSGSGMDIFFASVQTGQNGQVTGLDFSKDQLNKAKKLKEVNNFDNVSFVYSSIEELPFEDNSFDVVISNGVINLSPEKNRIFKEIARVLRPGGRMAISDIVSEKEFEADIKCDPDLWASCIGGAEQEDKYRSLIEDAGLKIKSWQENPQYQFLSDSAKEATEEYGVRSVSLLAIKES